MMMNIPDPNVAFPNEYKTSCFIKNVVTTRNVSIDDHLTIGKFCVGWKSTG